ncbi:MAG: hypothetical protein JRI23_19460 [Deltaproteobacteria bacterium]|jgi:hypothetical protein|nr:hypothetical protein [Deltaproteobacteria bacterium]
MTAAFDGSRAAARRQLGVTLCVALLVSSWGCTSSDESEPQGPAAYGFEEHLREAIALNTERKPIYGELTDGATAPLSYLLIASEEALLEDARSFDERARPFQAQGIPIVANDFVSMTQVAAHDAPIPHQGHWEPQVRDDAREALTPLLAVDPGQFEEVCALIYEALHALEGLEGAYDVHLAMTKHMLESAGLAALHAIDYAEQSDGATTTLSADLVAFQLVGPVQDDVGLTVDWLVAPFHELGVGIIVNDVPLIPFVAEYEATLGRGGY